MEASGSGEFAERWHLITQLVTFDVEHTEGHDGGWHTTLFEDGVRKLCWPTDAPLVPELSVQHLDPAFENLAANHGLCIDMCQTRVLLPEGSRMEPTGEVFEQPASRHGVHDGADGEEDDSDVEDDDEEESEEGEEVEVHD